MLRGKDELGDNNQVAAALVLIPLARITWRQGSTLVAQGISARLTGHTLEAFLPQGE